MTMTAPIPVAAYVNTRRSLGQFTTVLAGVPYLSWSMHSGPPNALVQLQAQYHHCGEAASEKCLSAATFVRPH